MSNLSLIVAIAENYAIGKNNDLLWHISNDLKHFKRLTTDHPVVMGKKTYESLPFKPLPNRENIVLSTNKQLDCKGCLLVHSIEEILLYTKNTEKEIFVMGGGSLYKELLPYASKMYITWVYQSFEADVFFPQFDKTEWILTEQSEKYLDEPSGLSYAFLTYLRKESSEKK